MPFAIISNQNVCTTFSFQVEHMKVQKPHLFKCDFANIALQVLVQFSQPSTSKQRLRDEEQPFERHTQPQLDLGP